MHVFYPKHHFRTGLWRQTDFNHDTTWDGTKLGVGKRPSLRRKYLYIHELRYPPCWCCLRICLQQLCYASITKRCITKTRSKILHSSPKLLANFSHQFWSFCWAGFQHNSIDSRIDTESNRFHFSSWAYWEKNKISCAHFCGDMEVIDKKTTAFYQSLSCGKLIFVLVVVNANNEEHILQKLFCVWNCCLNYWLCCTYRNRSWM